jgi:vitamin B12 transporter
MRKNFLFALSGMLVTVTVQAQDSLKQTLLHEVVISATRTEQPILEVPRSVSVISSQTIEKSLFNSVGELLSQQEGIYVVGGTQTPGSNQSLFMRGANSNQVVVMIDGKRITDPSSPNAVIDLSELSLTNVERIEVIRGSHSTLYGGSAIGGVVNIITKKGAAVGLHGNASLQGGSYGGGSGALSENVNLIYSLKNGFYVNASLFDQHVIGLDASQKKDLVPGTFATRDKDDFRKTDGQMKLGFKNKKWDTSVSYKKTDQRADIDAGAFADDDNYYVTFERNFLDYNIAYNLNDYWKVSLLGSYSDSERLSVNDSSVVDEDGDYDRSYFKGAYHGKIQTHEFQLNYEQGKIKALLGGGIYKEKMYFDTYYFSNAFGPYESKVNYDSIDTSADTKYVFGQFQYSLEHFSILAGSWLSNHSRFGKNATIEFNPSYRMKNALIYGSVSGGYNAPSLYQLFDPTKDYGAYTTRGNKNLTPEKSISYEIGVKKEFNNGSFITLSGFKTSVKNSIEYIYLWNGAKAEADLDYTDYLGDTYMNIAKQTVKGLEMGTHIIISRKIYVQGNLSLMKGTVTAKASGLDIQATGGNHVQLYNYGTFLNTKFDRDVLARRPKVTANAQIGYSPISKLTLNLAYRYAGSRYDIAYDGTLGPFGALGQMKVNHYGLMDFGAALQVSKAIGISAKVENLWDKKYQEISGFRTRGRSGYIKLTARL